MTHAHRIAPLLIAIAVLLLGGAGVAGMVGDTAGFPTLAEIEGG